MAVYVRFIHLLFAYYAFNLTDELMYTVRNAHFFGCRVPLSPSLPPLSWYCAQIWSKCDPTDSGVLTRDGFYLSLVYMAMAQQGKPVEERILQHLDGRGV